MKLLFLFLAMLQGAQAWALPTTTPTQTPTIVYFKGAISDAALRGVYEANGATLYLCGSPQGMLAYVRLTNPDFATVSLIETYGDASSAEEWTLAKVCTAFKKYPDPCVNCRWIE